MTPAISPTNEAQRLAALRALAILDSGEDTEFDALARTASLVCGTPISLISLVDADRQWFKANVGLSGVSETGRDVSFCGHAILGEDLFEVPDASLDPRFDDNPLVTGRPDIRFYAGVPLRMEDGSRVGTLCVIDRVPRRLDDRQREILISLATVAAKAMESRRAAQLQRLSATALAWSESRYRAIVEDQSELISLASADGTLSFVNQAYARHLGLSVEELVGRNFLDFAAEADRKEVAANLAAAVAATQPLSSTSRSRSGPGEMRWIAWTIRPIRATEGASEVIHCVGRDITEQRQAQADLREAVKERETLLREVYHRVKNNLQVIQSLLTLKRRNLPEGVAQEALSSCVQQVRAMALVHEKLYQTGTLATISLPEYTADLLQQIGVAHGLRERGISLQSQIEPVQASLDMAIPYGLLITELAGNSIKHGFPHHRPGKIVVRLFEEGGTRRLEVADNGVSLPADFDLAQSRSMGLQLASSLAGQLGGTLSAHHRDGAVFEARLDRLR